jgi:hypothetical protein
MPLAIAGLDPHRPHHLAGALDARHKGLAPCFVPKNTKISGQTLTDVNLPMSVARKNCFAKTRVDRHTVESALLERRRRASRTPSVAVL